MEVSAGSREAFRQLTKGHVCVYTGICKVESDFIPTASGGDGSDVQFCENVVCAVSECFIDGELDYVGFSPSLNKVIVAHQGTNPKKKYVLGDGHPAFKRLLTGLLLEQRCSRMWKRFALT